MNKTRRWKAKQRRRIRHLVRVELARRYIPGFIRSRPHLMQHVEARIRFEVMEA